MCEAVGKRLRGAKAGMRRALLSGMKRTATWAMLISIVVMIGAVTWVIVARILETPYQRSGPGTGASHGNPPVGTAGRDAANDPQASPATLHDLQTVTGTVDPHELIGRTVDFHAKVAEINNDTSFWVSNKDNRMLVVYLGAPSPQDIKPVAPGQTVHITGTIEAIPNAAGRYRWGLNDWQSRAVEDQMVYIRAAHVSPEG